MGDEQPKQAERSGSMAAWAVILVVAAVGVYFVGTIFSATAKPTCTMNGLGTGHCSFTNTDPVPWSICGHIVVHSETTVRNVTSPALCSGFVWPKSTNAVDFTVNEVRDLCATDWRSKQSWSDVCSFEFEKDK